MKFKVENVILCVLILFLFSSCDRKTAVQKEIEKIPLSVSLERFDKLFYETSVEDFDELRKGYYYFFPEEFPDSLYISKMQDPLNRELYEEVQLKYGDFSQVQSKIEDLLRGIKYYFPNEKIPGKIATLISEMEYENKIIYTDSILLISLDLYLGKDHRFYVGEFPAYFCQTFQRSQILPDIVSDFSTRVISYPQDRTLLGQMIYFGKEMYLKDVLLPKSKDHDKIGYAEEQLEWCKANESEMWRYFIEENLLYSTDSKNIHRFIAPAPFSKFYLEIDNESPGRVGVWLGWQIVRSYMKNNDISLQDLLSMNAQTIFEQSKYKPRK